MLETKTPHNLVLGKCSVCDYAAGSEETDLEKAPTEASPDDQTEQSQKMIPWWVLVLVGLGAAGLGVGIAVALTKKK